VQIFQKQRFKRIYKKRPHKQRLQVDAAIRSLVDNPELGVLKVGDLAGVRVHKFKVNNQETLLAYLFTETPASITLLSIGPHQNFYRNLKS
jgi:mRNA-degrading endonuclease RelE of RelBE toxin-antitoxin system